jgi:hypothetical protein
MRSFGLGPSGAAAQPPQGEARTRRSQSVETRTVGLCVRAPERSDGPRRPVRSRERDDQLVQFIDPALLMLDPVQCMLEMSGMLDFGTPKVV